MAPRLGSRIRQAWNVFKNKDPTVSVQLLGDSSWGRPDRLRLTRGNERSIITSIFNRIAMDVASLDFVHCVLDDDGRFKEEKKSGLNNCLKLEANLDQTSRAFMQDIVLSMFDEGCVAVIPVDYEVDKKGNINILTLRTGKIIEWYPKHVRVRVYNENTGRKEDITIEKSKVAIIENPLYAVINDTNSTVQRLKHKLSLLDLTDENNASGKLNMIVQVPYLIKTESRKKQAEERRLDIEAQLTKSKHGIAYTDGTEKVIQLNRPLDNKLYDEVTALKNDLFAQLGMQQSILDGTADEKAMLNYYCRSIEPIATEIILEFRRKFLTLKDRENRQSIAAFRDPFKLVPVSTIAEIADKFTRNEIVSSNEIRQKIGMKPSDDPKADQLINSNLNHPGEGAPQLEANGAFDENVGPYSDGEINEY